jgi:hypothetical protein
MVSFTPWPLYPEERAPGTHWIGGWVDPRAGLDSAEKRKFLTLPGLELRPLGRPVRSQSLYRLRYHGSLLKDRGSDTVLRDQSYRTPQGAVIDGYGAMLEWLLAGERRRKLKKILLQCHFIKQNSHEVIWDWTRGVAVRNQRIAASATARHFACSSESCE